MNEILNNKGIHIIFQHDIGEKVMLKNAELEVIIDTLIYDAGKSIEYRVHHFENGNKIQFWIKEWEIA